jgi:hypothetical protein
VGLPPALLLFGLTFVMLAHPVSKGAVASEPPSVSPRAERTLLDGFASRCSSRRS